MNCHSAKVWQLSICAAVDTKMLKGQHKPTLTLLSFIITFLIVESHLILHLKALMSLLHNVIIERKSCHLLNTTSTESVEVVLSKLHQLYNKGG